jgi:MoaA/NifB/PqqE/SkfB family radical SAM enzyme
MKLTGLHILLTYKCTYECDHCFVWGSPQQAGVFTLEQVEDVLQQALQVNSIRQIYFEGGETFIYYAVLVKAVRRAHELGFNTGIVTNGYWATSAADAWSWLRPLAEAGLNKLEISSDMFHGHKSAMSSEHPGLKAASRLGIPASIITVDAPQGYRDPESADPGSTLVGGDVMFRGRAADRLTAGLPRQPWQSFDACPYENLSDPSRIHLDPFGNLHLCQGLVMGNLWKRPLKEIVDTYDALTNPIIAPLVAGGPAQLAQEHHVAHDPAYVDACHFCYTMRQRLRPKYPEILAPDQMYGVPQKE